MTEIVEFKRREEMERFSTNRTDIPIVTTAIDFVVGVKLVPVVFLPIAVIYDIIVTAQTGGGGTTTSDVKFALRTLPAGTGAAVNDSSIVDIGANVSFGSDIVKLDSTNKALLVDALLVYGTAPA